MSIECWYCERDLRGPHAEDCPKRVMNEQKEEIERLLERNKLLEAVYEAASLHVEQFTPYALHTLDLRNALAAAQTRRAPIMPENTLKPRIFEHE